MESTQIGDKNPRFRKKQLILRHMKPESVHWDQFSWTTAESEQKLRKVTAAQKFGKKA